MADAPHVDVARIGLAQAVIVTLITAVASVAATNLTVRRSDLEERSFTYTADIPREMAGALYPKYVVNGRGPGADVEVHTTIAIPAPGTAKLEVPK